MRIVSTLLLIFVFQHVYSDSIVVGNTGDFPNLEAAESSIQAGDTVILQSQVFSDGSQFIENVNGTENAPIVILAEVEHQSIFRGGTEAIHLINCSYIEISGIVVEQQTGNGINIDDGGDYSSPSKFITIRNCIFRDMASNGNNDLLKMSGVDSFLIEHCYFMNGGQGGSGIDFVGCHWGTVQHCHFDDPGTSGIQNKGGTQFIRIQRNTFKNVAQRALNLGGSTGFQFFRPPLPDPIVDAFEAADLEVFANVFIGCWAPIAYVGSVRVTVYNNTFYQPENWVLRILQETSETGFLPCSNNEFRNNIVYLPDDLTEVNIGPNTEAESFVFSNNLWFNASSDNWSPNLPVVDVNQIIDDPLFEDVLTENFRIATGSAAVGNGVVLDQPTHDFDGNAFLQPPSIGAFEGGDEISDAKEENLQNFVRISPNPSDHFVEINGDFTDATIRMVNHLGQNVLNYQKISNNLIIQTDHLSAGLYFIVIESVEHDKIHVQKMVRN